MRGPRVAGVAVLSLLCALAPASAASSRTAPVTLGGTVTLSGSSSYVRDVVLPRPVGVAQYGTWKISAPKGRFAGFALRPAGSDETATYLAIQAGYCTGRACTRAPWAPFPSACLCAWPNSTGQKATLAAGRYRLYLVADGAPVTVTLTMKGLSGRTTIRSGTPHRIAVDTPAPAQLAPTTTAGLGGNAYSAGSRHSSPTPGLHFLTSWKLIVGPPRSVNHAGYCLAARDDAPPCQAHRSPSLFFSGQAETGRTTGPLNALNHYVTNFEFYGVRDEGAWSLGAYINSASPATEAHTQVLWLDFLPR